MRAEWTAGRRCRLESLLDESETSSLSSAHWIALIREEIAQRQAAGEASTIREYLDRFPDLRQELERSDLFSAEKPPSQFDVTTSVDPEQTHTYRAAAAADALPRQSTLFGDYEILGEIARGGMGVVYRARQKRLNRTVALKMILAGQLASDAAIRRFYAEAEAAAQLEHSGIVPIFDIGQRDGQHYFSMAYVAGQSLQERLLQGPMPPREAAQLIAQVADAVRFAHEKGIIHRDLKPHNILLDSAGQPKVTDFGLAKRSDSNEELTQSGDLLGTPSYMAPEQAQGLTREVGPQTDVYALGAILFATLTGRPPFQAASLADLLRQVIEQDPVPLRLLNAAIPKDLETICQACLRKPTQRRYPSAAALASDLERFLHGEPIAARPIGRAERLGRWCHRNPIVAALTVSLLIAIVAGVGGIFWKWRDAEFQKSLLASANSEIERKNETTEIALRQERIARKQADAIHEFLVNALLTSATPYESLGRDVTVREVLANASSRVAAAFENQPELEAPIRVTLADTYLSLADFDAAEQHILRADQLQQQHLPDSHELAAQIGSTLSQLRIHQGRADEGIAIARERLDRAQSQLGDEHRETLVLIDVLGSALRDQGRLDEAAVYLQRALDARKRTMDESSLEVMISMGEFALLLIDQGKAADAELLLQQTLDLERRYLGDKHPDALSQMNNLGLLKLDLRKLAEAEALFRECLAIRMVVQGPEHEATLTTMHNLALALGQSGQFDEAERLERASLEIRRRQFGSDHPDTLLSMGALGNILRDRRQFIEAEQLLRETVDRHGALFGAEHPHTIVMQANLGNVLLSQNRYSEAEPLLRQAVESSLRIIGPDHINTMRIHLLWTKALARIGRLSEAVTELRQSLAAHQRFFGADHRAVAVVQSELGETLLEAEDYVEAASVFQANLNLLQNLPEPNEREKIRNQLSLSACRLKLRQFDEAEQLLLDCHRSLQRPSVNRDEFELPTITGFVMLYDAWEKPEQATEWRRVMDELGKAGRSTSDDKLCP
jgi:serine/threonine protein kinase